MKSNMILLLCGLFVTGLANAECPASLNKEELIKCHNIEKLGANYQELLKEQNNMASDSTISPITGKDIKSVAPAAGIATTESKSDK